MNAKIVASIESTVPGKVYGVYTPNKQVRGSHFIRRVDAGYQVVSSWPVPEAHDEDPGSVTCRCGLQGRSHAHFERVCATAEEASAAYDAAWTARLNGAAIRAVGFTGGRVG